MIFFRNRENPNLAVAIGMWNDWSVGIIAFDDYASNGVPGELTFFPDTNENVPDLGACMDLPVVMSGGAPEAPSIIYAVPPDRTIVWTGFYDLLFDQGFRCTKTVDIKGFGIGNFYQKLGDDGLLYSFLISINEDERTVIAGYGAKQPEIPG